MTIAPSELLLLNFLVEDKKSGSGALDPLLGRALRALRTHLGLETAYIAQGRDGERVIRVIDTGNEASLLRPGSRDPFSTLPDRGGQIVAGARTHLSVPVTLDDGTIYGSLVGIGAAPDVAFSPRDASLIRVF